MLQQRRRRTEDCTDSAKRASLSKFLGFTGWFRQSNESTGQSVIRETQEEIGVTISKQNIEQLHTFSTPGRDPRGWVITVSYLAFIGEEPLSAGDDANQVRWFSLERKANQIFYLVAMLRLSWT